MTATPDPCPKFETCGAAICPADPSWPTAVHLPGEKVCPVLLATGKTGANERYGDDPVFAACRTLLPLVVVEHPDIGRKVKRAAATPFRSGRAVNLKPGPAGDTD